MTNYFEKELYINPSLADAEGLLNRYETFNLFMDVADDHAGQMGVAWRHISPRNLFWLTVKTKIVFEDRPKLGDTVTLATWVEEPTKLRGDRSYEMRQGDKVLVRGKTEWAVLNTETMKLIPIMELIENQRLVLIDDSIVRGTQLHNKTEFLKESGAAEVHVRSACPPIMFGCKYLNFSRSTSELELIARRMVQKVEGENVDRSVLDRYADPNTAEYAHMLDMIREQLNFDSLAYNRLDDMIDSVGIDPDKLCTYCWNGVE